MSRGRGGTVELRPPGWAPGGEWDPAADPSASGGPVRGPALSTFLKECPRVLVVDLANLVIPRVLTSPGVSWRECCGAVVRLARRFGCSHVVVCEEGDGPPWRRALVPEYKAQRRQAAREDHQDARIKQALRLCPVWLEEALGAAVVRLDGHEADDAAAAAVDRYARRQGALCVVASGDKDLLQLATWGARASAEAIPEGSCDPPAIRSWRPGCAVYDPRGGGSPLGAEEVLARTGVLPAQVPDLLAIAGDRSDGVPGLEGVGEVGARMLLQAFGSLENALAGARLGPAHVLDVLARGQAGRPTNTARAARALCQADPARLLAFRDVCTAGARGPARLPDLPAAEVDLEGAARRLRG